MPLPPWIQFMVLLLVGRISGQNRDVVEYLLEEISVLREQLGERRLKLTDAQRGRLAVRGKRLGRKLLGEVATIVTADTILRWYRQLIAQKYDGTQAKARKPGRPRVKEPLAQLVVRIALENPTFGYTRIRDAIGNLDRKVGRSTVARILAKSGIEPAPERGKKTSWATFLAAHWDTLAAVDFFSVEVLTLRGLVRHQVLVVMELCTRRVKLFVTRTATTEWVKQVFRGLTDEFDGFLRGTTHLIFDRDPIFSKGFRAFLRARGIEPVRLPRRSPNLNAFVERFVRSIKSECLSRLIPFGRRSLERAVRQYAEHYHCERNHQGLRSRLIDPGPEVGRAEGTVACRKRLGGMLRYYYRKAS